MPKLLIKKKKLRWDNVVVTFFFVTFIMYLLSVTVLRAQNVVMSKQQITIERKNDKLKNDVDNLELAVRQLDNRERILSIAIEHGLKVNQENIVSVTNR